MARSENYVLFIDESGKSKFSDQGEHFLLCCIIINKDLHSALSSYMTSLKEKSGIPTDGNIHAFDLFEDEKISARDEDNRRIRKRIPYTKIDSFFKKLSPLIEGVGMQCLILRINKAPYNKLIKKYARRKNVTERAIIGYLQRKNLDDFLYEALARKAILEFGHFLEKEDAHGEVMAESRREDDRAVLQAFIAATRGSTFAEESHYGLWASTCLKRIHSLTFQNKKGLSFGLEIADLFAWAHLNSTYGRPYPIDSQAKIRRVETRLKTIHRIMQSLLKNKPEDMTRAKIETIASDKVSEFTEALREYRNISVSSGTSPGRPEEPYNNNNTLGN